jgi:RNA polymerase sigma factor for flagellar operon FliA
MALTADIPEAELWDRWISQHERTAREALLQMHLSWARLVAKDVFLKVRIRGAEWADYAQNATLGLLEAIDRYQPGRGVDFRTYARHRVRGSVFNGLRHLASIPQAEHSRTSLRERSESLAGEETDPLEAFVSWTVGLGLGHLLEAASIEDANGDLDRGPYATTARSQLLEALQRALAKLSEREKAILTLHYFQHVPFTEIATQMEVTKGRISQLHRQAIHAMRKHMKSTGGARAFCD